MHSKEGGARASQAEVYNIHVIVVILSSLSTRLRGKQPKYHVGLYSGTVAKYNRPMAHREAPLLAAGLSDAGMKRTLAVA